MLDENISGDLFSILKDGTVTIYFQYIYNEQVLCRVILTLFGELACDEYTSALCKLLTSISDTLDNRNSDKMVLYSILCDCIGLSPDQRVTPQILNSQCVRFNRFISYTIIVISFTNYSHL